MQGRLTMMGLVSCTSLLLYTCSTPHNKAQSVGWYSDHVDQRSAKLQWCKADTVRTPTADCVNASKSQEKANLTRKVAWRAH